MRGETGEGEARGNCSWDVLYEERKKFISHVFWLKEGNIHYSICY